MDCSLPGSSAHGIFQARVLEWGAIAFSIKYYRGLQQKLIILKYNLKQMGVTEGERKRKGQEKIFKEIMAKDHILYDSIYIRY